MGVFDQASRYAVNAEPAAFFAWLLPCWVARFDFAGWADTSTLAFPGEPDRICDTVAEFVPREGGDRRLLDVEFQSEPHTDMRERMGGYGYRLRREIRYGPEGERRKYRLAGMVVNLTGPAQAAELDQREAELDGAGHYLLLVQVTLREESAAELLGRVEAGELARAVLPWVPLMQGGGDPAIIGQWKRLAEGEPDVHRRADHGGLALVFAELAGRLAVWKQALEGWNVQQSQQVLEWQREARTNQLREDIRRGIQTRYRIGVPDDLDAALARLTDLDELNRWFDAVLTADTLDAFRGAVGPGSASGQDASADNGEPPESPEA